MREREGMESAEEGDVDGVVGGGRGGGGGGFPNQMMVHGGPIYVNNLVAASTTPLHFQHFLLLELQKLRDELSSLSVAVDDDDDEEDLSVDELRVLRDEDLVNMALKEALREEEEDGSSGKELYSDAAEGREDGGDRTSCSLHPASLVPSKECDTEASSDGIMLETNSEERKRRKVNAVASKIKNSSNKSNRKKGQKRAIATTVKNTSRQPKRRKGKQLHDDESYHAKVDQFVRMKEKQGLEKAAARLHSLSARYKNKRRGYPSSAKTERLKFLRSFDSWMKVKSSETMWS